MPIGRPPSRPRAAAFGALVAALAALAAPAAATADAPIPFVIPAARQPKPAAPPTPSAPVPFLAPAARDAAPAPVPAPASNSRRLGAAFQAAAEDIQFVAPTPLAPASIAPKQIESKPIEPTPSATAPRPFIVSLQVIDPADDAPQQPAAPRSKPANALVQAIANAAGGDVEQTAAQATDDNDLSGLGLLQPNGDAEPLDDPALTGVPGTEATPDRRPYRPITDLSTDIALPSGLAPGMPGSEVKGAKQDAVPDAPEIGDARLEGAWPGNDFQWSATAMKHRPLYFEDVNAERYGYTISPILQPAVSGAHFFANIAALPYKMTANPPNECIYTLGHYRPGDCNPRRWHHAPVDPLAGGVQAGTVLGLIYIIP